MIKEKPSSRLQSIDALRGAAALSVVVYHALGSFPKFQISGIYSLTEYVVRSFFSFGYSGVYLFFVISGFCIHLQWVRAKVEKTDQKIEFTAFWKRRLWRLYPPYLFAVFLYLSLYALRGSLKIDSNFLIDLGLHLTLLHNFTPTTCYSINSAFWTLAIEEQLYLAYFLLLFLRIKFGWGKTLTICFSARVIWFIFCTFVQSRFKVTIPLAEGALSHWFSWALGAMGVEAFFGLTKLPKISRNISVSIVSLAAAGSLTLLLPKISGLWHDLGWLILDPLWGVGFFALINWLAFSEDGWRRELKLPLLIKHLATVGIFSYSLYLTHQYLLLNAFLLKFIKLPSMLFSLFVITPLAVGFAWVFFRYCEKPFIKTTSKKEPNKKGSENSLKLDYRNSAVNE
ncbi:MAG: acyltransferase [Blastocatellia bacterium]|nr:acyltransferase [Blastocatellia bacterium]